MNLILYSYSIFLPKLVVCLKFTFIVSLFLFRRQPQSQEQWSTFITQMTISRLCILTSTTAAQQLIRGSEGLISTSNMHELLFKIKVQIWVFKIGSFAFRCTIFIKHLLPCSFFKVLAISKSRDMVLQ